MRDTFRQYGSDGCHTVIVRHFSHGSRIRQLRHDARPVIVLMRSCDIHAVKRLDQMYTGNGPNNDWFYERLRDRVKFALIGCGKACPNSFCVDMGSNKTDEY